MQAVKSGANDVKTTTGKVVSFAEKEIPQVLHQYLTWHWMESFITWISFLALLIGTLVVFKKLVINNWQYDWDSGRGNPTIHGAIAIITIIFTLVVIPVSVTGLYRNTNWIKISVAPHVYLLEEGAKLIKK